MAKQVIRLTEGDLHRIIKESVKRILREDAFVDYKDEYRDLTPEELESLKAQMAKELKTPAGKSNLELKRRFAAVKELLGANILKNPDAYWSQKENERRGIYTYDQWKQCDPRKRKDVEKKPKESEIAKGRKDIAKDAFEKEKDLRRREQGSMAAIADNQ